jgi:hypothetical protein
MSGKYSAEWWEKVSRNRQVSQVSTSPSLAPVADPERDHPKTEPHGRRNAAASRQTTRTMNDHPA